MDGLGLCVPPQELYDDLEDVSGKVRSNLNAKRDRGRSGLTRTETGIEVVGTRTPHQSNRFKRKVTPH